MKKKELMKNISEKVNIRRENLSIKFKDWKDHKYPYWQTHIFNPWKKALVKKIRRGWKNFSKLIRRKIKYLLKKYRKSNLVDKKARFNINIKIKNIENIKIGEKKIKYKNILNLPSTPGEKERIDFRDLNNSRYNCRYQNLGADRYYRKNIAAPILNYNNRKKFLNYTQKNMNNNFIFGRFEHIQNLYRKQLFQEVISESQKLIENLLEMLSLHLGFDYENVNYFVNLIIRKNLEYQFFLYNEIVEYAEFLDDIKHENLYKDEAADGIFLIIKKIVNKIRYAKTKPDKNYSTNLLLEY